MRPQYLVILLKVITFGDTLACKGSCPKFIYQSVRDTESLARSHYAGLISCVKRRVNKLNLWIFLFMECGMYFMRVLRVREMNFATY